MANIAVIGAGYVGLVTGAGLAKLGHNVTCVEIDSAKLATLESHRLPIFEVGLDELVFEQLSLGQLRFTDEYAAAIPSVDFCFVAVNTPSLAHGRADTSAVFACVESIRDHCQNQLTLVLKSTVPVGTGDAIAQRLAMAGERQIQVVSNPEFLRQGTALKDFFFPSRIVVGSDNLGAAEAVAELFSRVDAPLVICSRRSAELAKYASNSYLAMRISFINEMAAICDATGADIKEVGQVIGLDPRIGPHYLSPGLGWGGSCLPKDVLALMNTAARSGNPSRILEAIFETNGSLPRQALQQLSDSGLNPGMTVGVLGLAFKPGTDDIRGAPAVELIRELVNFGCEVKVHDPRAMEHVRRLIPGLKFCPNAYDLAKGCDAIVLATEWEEYLNLNWGQMQMLMAGRLLFDGRNVLDGQLMTEIGFSYRCLGRRASFLSEDVFSAPMQLNDAA